MSASSCRRSCKAMLEGPTFTNLWTTSVISSGNIEWSLVGWPMAKASLTNSPGVLWIPIAIDWWSVALAHLPSVGGVLSLRAWAGKGWLAGWGLICTNSDTMGGRFFRGCMSVVALMVCRLASWGAKTGGEQTSPSFWSWVINLVARALHRSHGYAVSSAVVQVPSAFRPQGSCSWSFRQKASKVANWGMLCKSLVSLHLELPYLQWWNETSCKSGESFMKATKGLVCHINDRPGFSTEKYVSCIMHQLTSSQVTWYRLFAASTRALRVPLSPGMQSGWVSVRMMGGFHLPRLCISLALELVPQGGAKWTYRHCGEAMRSRASFTWWGLSNHI